MAIEFFSVSGYDEVGKNMCMIKYKEDAVILDMGFYMQKIAGFEEEKGNVKLLNREQMIGIEAIPDDSCLESYRKNVRAIIFSHAHFDHIGATPYLAPRYNAPIIGTPYTIEVLKNQMKDDNLFVKNPMKIINSGGKYRISNNMEIEFIRTAHSIPQTVMVAVHTKEGTVLYTNDFKFDNHPVIGDRPNYDRLRKLENVKLIVADALYCGNYQKTPSERVAREMLKEVMLGTESRGNAMIITCFASNIPRLKSIVDFGKEMGRKIFFFGRSMYKYCEAAKNVGLIDFNKFAEIVGRGDKIKRKLHQVEKQGKGDYLIVCTGGQGEPRSVLSRMINKVLPFYFSSDDSVIFSNKVIPVEPNLSNRDEMEKKLRNYGVRIFRDIHTSGHASYEDLRDLIKMTNPEHVVPAHACRPIVDPMEDLVKDMGFNKTEVHFMNNGRKIMIE